MKITSDLLTSEFSIEFSIRYFHRLTQLDQFTISSLLKVGLKLADAQKIIKLSNQSIILAPPSIPSSKITECLNDMINTVVHEHLLYAACNRIVSEQDNNKVMHQQLLTAMTAVSFVQSQSKENIRLKQQNQVLNQKLETAERLMNTIENISLLYKSELDQLRLYHKDGSVIQTLAFKQSVINIFTLSQEDSKNDEVDWL